MNSKNEQAFNRALKMSELECAESLVKPIIPGLDNVHYNMLKNLPSSAMKYLLDIYNKFWSENYFPEEWRRATICPIPKPGKPNASVQLPTNSID